MLMGAFQPFLTLTGTAWAMTPIDVYKRQTGSTGTWRTERRTNGQGNNCLLYTSLGGLGGFSGAFSLEKIKEMEEPVLLSGTDGCGTKVKLAMILDKHDTIGIDAVAMCRCV